MMTEELLNSFNNGAKKWKPDPAGVWQLYITYFRSCQAQNRGIERLNRKIKKLNIELQETQSYKADAERYQVLKKAVYPNDLVVNMNIGHDWIEVNNKELDKAIDQAMRESN